MNKLGFSKRSFAEWGTQIKASFSEGTTYIEKFKNALQAMFVAQSSKNNDSWLRTDAGDIVSKDNIDSYIPKIDTDYARTELENLQNIQNVINETKGSWDDYNDEFRNGRKYLLDYAKSNNVLESSVDNVKEANQKARKDAIAHNAALKQQTLGAKAAAVSMKALAIAGNMLAMGLVAKGVELAAKAIDNYIHRIESAREKLNKVTSEIESIDTELENLRDAIDKILAKDTISLTDENELKQLKEEVELLEAKRKLLEAQEYENQQETNQLITEQYNKYFKTAIVTKPDGSIAEEDGLSYVKSLYTQAKEYSSSSAPLSEEEKLNFESIKEGAVDLGFQLTDLLEDFNPLNSEEEKQKEAMEEMLGYATQIADMYAGTIPDITKRLEEKFAHGVSSDTTDLWAKEDQKIAEWIESLSDEDKKIMLNCDIDDTSLDNLKRYLAEQKGETPGTNMSIGWDCSETITQLDTIKSNLSVLDEIFTKFNDSGEQISFEDFSSISKAFNNLDGIDGYILRLQEAGQDQEAVTTVMEDLISAYLDYSGILDNVTVENAGMIQQALTECGIDINMADYVSALTHEKELLSDVTSALYSDTDAEISGFFNEMNASVETQQYLSRLALEKLHLNNVQIDTSSDIDNIISLAETAGSSAKVLGELSKAKSVFTQVESGSASGMQFLNNGMYDEAKKIIESVENGTYDFEFSINRSKFKYSGGSHTQNTPEASSAAKNAEQASKTTFDFIETALSRIEQTIDRISKRVSATYKSYRYRNNALAEELELLKQQEQVQKEAYDLYMKQADAVGLDENIASKVRDGDMSISDIDDDLSGQINEYKQYYEAAQECAGAVQDLRDSMAELVKTRFDMITEQYDNYLSTIEHRQNIINNDIDIAESQNKIAGTSFYEELINQENKRLSDLSAEYEKLTQSMNDAVSGGYITKGSDMWYDMKQQIDGVSESIQESEKKLLEFESSIRAVQKLKFDATESQYDNAIKLLTDEMSMTDSAVSLIETSGHLASADYYKQLIEAAHAELDANTYKLGNLENQLTNIEEYSEEWYDATAAVNSTRSAIIGATESLIKYSNSMRELDWTIFDRTQTAISNLVSEQNWIADILSFNENDLYNDNGSLSDSGLAVQGLHVLNYKTYIKQAGLYADEIREIRNELEKDPTNTTLLDRYDELSDKQRKVVSNINSEKNAVKELISEGYNRLLESVTGLIGRYKDALSARKSIYDYERKIKELADTRDTYVKQLSAYSGDNSEETKALIQEVTRKLKESNEALIDAEYDQYISDQEKMLDYFYNELEVWINTRLDDIDGLMREAIAATNENASSIAEKIESEVGKIGGILSTNESSLLELLKVGADADTTEDGSETATDRTIGNTIYNIQKDMSELPTKLDTLLGSDSPVTSVLKDIKSVIDLMYEAIANTEPETAEASYDFSDDDDDDDDDDDYEPAVSSGSGGNSPERSGGSSKSSSSGSSTYWFEVTGGGYTQNVGVTADSQKDADANIAAYVDGLNDEDDDAGYGYRRHARGIYSLRRRELAWTQEEGGEMILSPSRNAVLTPLERGDSVLTKTETDNIYDWAKTDPSVLLSRSALTPDIPITSRIPDILLPDIQHPASGVSNDIEMNISLPNVSNYTEFVDRLQRDRRFEKIVQAMTIGNALGKNSYSKMKY